MALRWAGIGSPVKIGQLKPASSSSSADPADHIPIEADRGSRIVTAHSGLGRKSVNFEQNPRSASSRITGHVRSESAVNLVRNTQYWSKRMANGWNSERKVRQSELIRRWKPWRRSTGPKSPEGKAKAAGNADKGSNRAMLKVLARLLKGR